MMVYSSSLGSIKAEMESRLVDMKSAHSDQACRDCFISGYWLAHGIHQGLLANEPPYDFEDENERQACERFREENVLERRIGKETFEIVSLVYKTRRVTRAHDILLPK